LKVLRYFSLIIAALLLTGIAVNMRPIVPPAQKFDTPEGKTTINKTDLVRKSIDTVNPSSHKKEVPDWVKSEAMKQVTNTSWKTGIKALSAWRSHNRFNGTLDERGYCVDRPAPPDEPPSDSGAVDIDNNWFTDRRVNNDASSQQFHPSVCVGEDGIIYVAWAEEINADNYWIYFSKSTDGGENWISAINVDNVGINNRVRIACYGTGSTADVYVGYTYWYNPDEYDYDVICAVSNNGGSSWPYHWSIQATNSYEDMASIVTDDAGYVYYAYVYGWVEGGGCDPDEAEAEVLMRRSNDHGHSWSSAYYLTNYGGQHDDFLPSMATYGGGSSCILHLGWVHDNTTSGGNYNVYYKRITNAGSSPSIPSSYISISDYSAQEYVIPGGIDVDSEGNPHIAYAYSTSSNGGGDIRYRRSYDGGYSFAAYQNISSRSTEETDCVCRVDDKNNPTIVWRDARNGNYDVYLKYSDDEGSSWCGEYKVNQDGGSSNQYWPGAAMWSDGWERYISVVWWDERYDDGDVYFNGNGMTGVEMDVDYIPAPPPSPMPGFSFRTFESSRDTSFDYARQYRIWFDPEYSNDPLLDELWFGSSSTQRWATDNPGSWTWISPYYYTPPDSGGSYDVHYHQQFRVIFDAIKGNPSACTHTLPNIDINYTSFGNNIYTNINDVIACTAWVDYGTEYDMTGWIVLSPLQRWATNSADTIGIVMGTRLVQPYYYHQWLPLVLFVGPSETNTVFTEIHQQFGESHVESGLYDRWEQWTDCGSMVDFSDTTVPDGWYAIDSTWFTCLEYSVRTIRYSNNSTVVIKNDFNYGNLSIDGYTVASPDTESWGPGSVHNIGAISPQTFGDSISYYFDHWSDSGAISHDITVPEHDVTYIAYSKRKYKLDMSYTGTTGGHIPTLTGEGWYWEDSLANISASEHWDSLSGTRYGFSHWESIPSGAWFGDSASPTTTVLMDKHYEIIAVYAVQYKLNVFSSGGYGYPDPPIGENWVDAGAYFCANAGSPDTVSHMHCIGWSGTGPVPSTGTADEACFYMTSSGSITWHWDDQITLTIISPFGVPDPSTGTHYYTPGDYVECSVPSPFPLSPNTRANCTGYEGTSVIGSGSGSYVDFIISESCTLTWNWVLQYSLEVTNPGGYGDPVPPVGVSWHNAGSEVMARVLSPDPPMVCIGFNGSPPTLPASSPQDSVVFNMIAPTTLQWIWAPGDEVYSLTVYSGGLGDPVPYGTSYYLPGTMVNCSVTSPFPDPADPGLGWLVEEYTGTGSCPSGSGSSTGSWPIWSNSTITWSWRAQYRLLIASDPAPYGDPDPEIGEHWYDPGTYVSGSVTSPWEDSVVCTGYSGTGSAPTHSSSTSFGFSLDGPSSVTWEWDISTVSLEVESDFGTPNPDRGTHIYASGTNLDLSVNKYHYVTSTERWKCSGWRGTGNVPASGSDTLINVTLTSESSITWNWVRQFRVDIDNPGDYDTPVPAEGQHWFNYGEWVSCYISTNPVDTMYCVGYYGTGDCIDAWGTDEVNFLLTQYSTVQWVWMGISDIESLLVESAHGSPYPDLGVHYYPHGVLADVYMENATEPVGSGVRFKCIGYTGTGCVPSGSDTSASFTMSSSGSIVWNWEQQFTFEVLNPGGYDTPVPGEGEYWFTAGDEVDAYITTNPFSGMVCVGYDGWGSLGDGYGDSVHFNLDEPSGITWDWQPETGTHTLTIISPFGPCDPPVGVSYIPDGEVVEASAGPYGYESDIWRHTAVSYVGTGCAPAGDDTNIVSFTMISDASVTWNWADEYYVALNYGGCGGGVPTQIGEGWYQGASTTEIMTSSSVVDGANHYGFLGWRANIPSAVDIEYADRNNTDIEVFAACTVNASYGPAVACTLTKNYPESWGGFIVDGVPHMGTHTYVDWWAVGSYHTIEATEIDTMAGYKYTFARWSDGGDICHDVGPVSLHTTYVANYIEQYRLYIQKNPVHSAGFIEVDGTAHSDSASLELWYSPGAAPTVGVSEFDYPLTDERYTFDSWSDAGALNHVIEPLTAPINMVAYYNQQYRLMVAKEPPERYGSITINENLYEFVPYASEWFDIGSGPHSVNVSRYDVFGDSVFEFINFEGDPTDTVLPKYVTLSEPESLTAFYNGFIHEISLLVSPNEWHTGIIPTNFTRTMIPPESIYVENTGNVPIDLGLSLIMDDRLTIWECSCINGADRVAIRAHFNQSFLPPTTFSAVFDCVKEMNTWADDLVFGTHGWDIPVDETQKLWLQMWTPLISSDYTEQQIVLKVMARVTLY